MARDTDALPESGADALLPDFFPARKTSQSEGTREGSGKTTHETIRQPHNCPYARVHDGEGFLGGNTAHLNKRRKHEACTDLSIPSLFVDLHHFWYDHVVDTNRWVLARRSCVDADRWTLDKSDPCPSKSMSMRRHVWGPSQRMASTSQAGTGAVSGCGG